MSSQTPDVHDEQRPRLVPPSHYSTHEHSVVKPLPFFHPTRAELYPHEGEDGPTLSSSPSFWNSRVSRKRRFTLGNVHVRHHRRMRGDLEVTDSRTAVVMQRLRHPHSRLKPHLTWDISFWVAVVFVLGSAAWVSGPVSRATPQDNDVLHHLRS